MMNQPGVNLFHGIDIRTHVTARISVTTKPFLGEHPEIPDSGVLTSVRIILSEIGEGSMLVLFRLPTRGPDLIAAILKSWEAPTKVRRMGFILLRVSAWAHNPSSVRECNI
jgi:hypothetical protein|tara:strand:- start:31446 stop:31778 length:333 start_codon:yes stop_codon:yes gene_type:complete